MTGMLPSNVDAERALLGSILMNRDAMSAIVSTLTAEMFYLEPHVWIYEAMLSAYRARITPSLITVAEHLRARQRLDLIGGIPFIAGLTDAAPSSYYIQDYAEIVVSAYLRRKLIEAGAQIARLAVAEDDDIGYALSKAQSLLAPLAARQQGDRGLVRIDDVMGEVVDFLYSEDDPAVATGFADYDRNTGGLFRGELNLVAGRPRHGKSAWAGSVAANVARNGGVVLVWSLEMSRLQMGIRYLANQAKFDSTPIRRKRGLNDAQRQQLVNAAGSWTVGNSTKAAELYIDDRVRSIDEIVLIANSFYAKHGRIDLIIVDYMQLVKASGSTQRSERRDQIGDVGRQLLALGRDTNSAMLVPTQMNRDIESRNDRTPLLSDLGDSGELERAANRIDFLIRPSLWNEEEPEGAALLYTEKDRSGMPCVTPLVWDGPTTTFHDAAPKYRTPEGY